MNNTRHLPIDLYPAFTDVVSVTMAILHRQCVSRVATYQLLKQELQSGRERCLAVASIKLGIRA